MRHRQPRASGSLFQGNEFMRLMTMIVMLAVLFMLISRSQDPKTWSWLVGDTRTSELRSASDARQKVPEPANQQTDANKSKETTPAPGGPTDQDPEEADALKEELQVISDGTLKIQHVEKNAYYRLLRWVENQSLAQMRRRARKDITFNQFYQTPDKYRGQLFELKLTAHLIRGSEVKFNGKDLYEVWGTTTESKLWLYDGIVIDLPKGMPIGQEIYEQVTLVGYFFKLQGYQPADAKPNAAPLRAPLLIGRLLWHPAEKPLVERSDWYWGLFLLMGFLAFIIIRWGLLCWKPRRGSLTPSQKVLTRRGGAAVEDWLARTETNEAKEENGSDDADSQHGASNEMT